MASSALGPHVVGQRVVVRYAIDGASGPSGGPLLTDVLGICTTWGREHLIVQRDSGEVLTIPLRVVVAGKPVPPRESVRLRVSDQEAEERALALWDPLEVEALDTWWLRQAPALPDLDGVTRHRGRSNSALAMADLTVSFADAERAIREWYAARARPAQVQVVAGSATERAFVEAGWTNARPGEADCVFQIAGVAQALRGLQVDGRDVLLSVEETELPPGVPAPGNPARAVRRVFAWWPGDDGEILASAHAALSGDWVGIHNASTRAAHRGQGLMRHVVAAILDDAASQGATTAYLHTVSDNDAALRLYERAGFVTHHAYRYLTVERPAAAHK